MRIHARRHFGLAVDPWAKLELRTADAVRVEEMAVAAAEAQAMVSVLGSRGAGKTRAVRSALRGQANVKIVEPLRLERERLHMGDIETAIVRELSDEPARRSGEARSHQVRRILGPESQRSRIVLVLEDSHVLHHSTLKGLKRLRELAWVGRAPLLGIVLVGQRDRTEKIPEVGLRSDSTTLAGLSRDEVVCALDRTGYSAVFADAALAKLSEHERARNWLDLQLLADACLGVARASGSKRVEAAHVATVIDGPQPEISAPAAASDEAIGAFLTGGTERRAAA